MQPPLSLQRTKDWIEKQRDSELPASLSFIGSSTKARLYCRESRTQKPSVLHGASFDSQDSSGTCQSFRIAADHCGVVPLLHQDTRDQARKDKLAIAGVLEQCTQMLHQSLLPAKQRIPGKTSSFGGMVFNNVQRNETIVSLAASLTSRVSAEYQAKSIRTIQKAVRKCSQTIEERERQLASVKEEVSRKMRDPMVTQLTEEAENTRRAIKASSRSSFRLKLEMQELRIEMDTLRRVRRDACTSVHRLRDCRSKYGKVCAENCTLNRTIQQLQGAVRVVCHVPVRQTGSYLETTNRREVTLSGKKKSRSYSVDDVISGQVSAQQMHAFLKPIATSVLDGMDATLIGTESLDGREESCFGDVMTHAIDALLHTVDDRYYHASYDLEFELLFISAHHGHDAVSTTRLPAKLRVSEEMTTNRLTKIKIWLTELLSRRDRLQNFKQAHAVIRINTRSRARHEGERSKKLSTLSLIQIHPASAGKWMDVKQTQSVASTLIELSADRTPLLQLGEKDASPLLQEILQGNNNNPKIYTLFLELSNALDDMKKDKAALHLCSKIMASRVVSMDEKSTAREKTAHALKNEIAEKDEKISKLEGERVELSNHHASVLADVERLRSEIETLQALKNNKRPSLERRNNPQQTPTKQTVTRKQPKSIAQQQRRRSQKSDRSSTQSLALTK